MTSPWSGLGLIVRLDAPSRFRVRVGSFTKSWCVRDRA